MRTRPLGDPWPVIMPVIMVLPLAILSGCSSVPASDDSGDSATGTTSDTSTAGNEDTGNEDTGNEDTESGAHGNEDTGNADTGNEDTESGAHGNEDTGNADTGNADTGNASGSTGGGESSGGPSTGSPGNEAPVILSLSASPDTLLGEGTVVVTAIVTDPDGIADLIGGVITTPDGVAYGALASAADEGSYEIELSWDDFNQQESIESPPYEGSDRDLHLEFFDQAGASVEAIVSITLEASVDGFAVCDGTSVSWQSDTNCGACGFSCLNPPGSILTAICLNEFPEDESGCFGEGLVSVFNSSTTCAAACANAAGPFAEVSEVAGCHFQNVGVDCATVHPADCPTTSVDNPPAGCTPGQDAILQCECGAVYEP